jgi:sigma-B regulation protein RsbU (phosphoserine phosphatase)
MADLMHDLGEAFTEDLRTEDLLQVVADCCLRISHAGGVAIYLYDDDHRKFHARAVAGRFPALAPLNADPDALAARPEALALALKSAPLDASTGVLADTVRAGRLLIVRADEDRRFPANGTPGPRMRSFAAAMLHYRDDVFGVIAVTNPVNDGRFTQADLEVLQSVANQTGYALHNANVLLDLAEKQRLDREVEVAREIQNVLLPDTCPNIPGFDIQALNVAARDVSGDYFDFIPLNDGRWGLAIADVSGKGVPASLVMAVCRSVLRSLAPDRGSPAQLLRDLNRRLYPDIREDMFITMVYAILDPADRTLTLARAGHERPLLVHDGRVEMVQSRGMPLGIDSGDTFDTVVDDVRVGLAAGDSVVLYTDGVTEALDANGREFGKDNLFDAIREGAHLGADAVIRCVLDRLDRFRGEAPPADDVTLSSLYAQR